jgi:hypothetical protein
MHRTYYIYQADTYCQPCGKTLVQDMMQAGELRLDYNDSNSWPQVASTLQESSDYPDHCATCEELLGLNLTPEGYDYIKEQASHGITDTVQEWIDYYQVELD